ARARCWGLAHMLTVPAAIESVELPLWPLQFMLLLERIPHPDSDRFGAPLSVNDTSAVDWPWSRVRMQEFSVPLPGATIEFAPTAIELIATAERTLVGTEPLTVAV